MAILLRPEADGAAMTGKLVRRHPPDRENLEFRYDVIRLWQLPAEALLSGGLGIVPLALLARDADQHIETIVDQIQIQVAGIADSPEKGSLLTAAFVLMGLRYSRETAEMLLRSIPTIEESVTYQAIVEQGIAKGLSLGITQGREKGLAEGRQEGRVETAREILIRLGTKRFGHPPATILTAIQKLSDYEHLEHLAERLIDIKGWEGLFNS